MERGHYVAFINAGASLQVVVSHGQVDGWLAYGG